MPLSRLTQTLPLACAAAISGLAAAPPAAALVFFGASEAGAELVVAGLPAVLDEADTALSVLSFFAFFLDFLVVSTLDVSLEPACGVARASGIAIVNIRQNASIHSVSLRLEQFIVMHSSA